MLLMMIGMVIVTMMVVMFMILTMMTVITPLPFSKPGVLLKRMDRLAHPSLPADAQF
jgi:hypothetical protein